MAYLDKKEARKIVAQCLREKRRSTISLEKIISQNGWEVFYGSVAYHCRKSRFWTHANRIGKKRKLRKAGAAKRLESELQTKTKGYSAVIRSRAAHCLWILYRNGTSILQTCTTENWGYTGIINCLQKTKTWPRRRQELKNYFRNTKSAKRAAAKLAKGRSQAAYALWIFYRYNIPVKETCDEVGYCPGSVLHYISERSKKYSQLKARREAEAREQNRLKKLLKRQVAEGERIKAKKAEEEKRFAEIRSAAAECLWELYRNKKPIEKTIKEKGYSKTLIWNLLYKSNGYKKIKEKKVRKYPIQQKKCFSKKFKSESELEKLIAQKTKELAGSVKRDCLYGAGQQRCDILLEGDRIIIEIKHETRSIAIQRAIGQGTMYAHWRPDCRRILVVPSDAHLYPYAKEALLLGYHAVCTELDFPEVLEGFLSSGLRIVC